MKLHFNWKNPSYLYEFSNMKTRMLLALETSLCICWTGSFCVAHSRVFPPQMWMFHVTEKGLFRHGPLPHWLSWQVWEKVATVQPRNLVPQNIPGTQLAPCQALWNIFLLPKLLFYPYLLDLYFLWQCLYHTHLFRVSSSSCSCSFWQQ